MLNLRTLKPDIVELIHLITAKSLFLQNAKAGDHH